MSKFMLIGLLIKPAVIIILYSYSLIKKLKKHYEKN